MKRWVIGLACLLSLTGASVPQSSAADAPIDVIGRVYHIEGDLFRYVPEEKDWVAMVVDAPFGTEDVLSSGNWGMAELIVPNGTGIRIGNSTTAVPARKPIAASTSHFGQIGKSWRGCRKYWGPITVWSTMNAVETTRDRNHSGADT